MLYNKGMIFYFNHFSLIIFYHSVWLGFELFGLRVQVCCQLVQFTLARKGYGNHHCHDKPQTGNGLECGWRHAQKRWPENLEDFEKESNEFRPLCWEVGVWPWCWEVVVRPWCWEVGVRPWCWEVGVRPWCWGVRVRPWCWEVGIRPGSWAFVIGTCRLLPLGQGMEFSAWELSFLPLRRWLSLLDPDKRRWIET